MDFDGFKKYLTEVECFKSKKVITDYCSRARRLETEMMNGDPKFTYESAYKKDKGQAFLKMIARFGAGINFKTNLPLGTNQMSAISAAGTKYLKYLAYLEEHHTTKSKH